MRLPRRENIKRLDSSGFILIENDIPTKYYTINNTQIKNKVESTDNFLDRIKELENRRR